MKNLICFAVLILALYADAATYIYTAFTTNTPPVTTNVVLSIVGAGAKTFTNVTVWGDAN